MKNEWIIHIDGDGFFAYCEIARFPQYKGKAVVVGEDRGIACAMTYEAKALGITRGMPIFKIRDQFPQVIVLSSHFELYERYASNLFAIVDPYVDLLERYSIDECFASVTLPKEWDKPLLYAWLDSIKTNVQDALGITFSFGMARTKVLAKIASKYEKPDGCTIFLPEDESCVLKKVPIGDIWGVGYRLGPTLRGWGIHTAYDFSMWSIEKVSLHFSTPVQSLWYELNGKKMFAVNNESSLPKSLQSTKSFVPSSTDKRFVSAELLHNLDIVTRRMRGYGVLTNAVSIFLKTVERRYTTVFIPLPLYTHNPLEIAPLVQSGIDTLFALGKKYKATGITVWNLRPLCAVPVDFFGEQEREVEKGTLMNTVDMIRHKFGAASIGVLGALRSSADRLKKTRMLDQKSHYIKKLPLAYLGEVT